MSARSGAIDALRVLGIVAIVAGHTWDNELARTGLYTWHVPLFFFLTGYLWTRTRPLGDELFKRMRTLLVPYVVWLVIVGAMFETWLYLRGEFELSGLIDLVWGGNHLGRPLSAFWFVTALFMVAVVLRILQALPMWVPLALAVAGIIVAHTNGDQLASIPLSIGVAWPCLIFVLAGYGLRVAKLASAVKLRAGAAMFAAGTVLAATGAAAPLNIKQADFGTPVLSILMAASISGGVLLLAEVLFTRLSAGANALPTVLASAGLMVVLTHAVPLWALGVQPEGSLVGFLASLLLPWGAALVTSLTPLAPTLVGVPRNTAASFALLCNVTRR
jgi:acyltransferase